MPAREGFLAAIAAPDRVPPIFRRFRIKFVGADILTRRPQSSDLRYPFGGCLCIIFLKKVLHFLGLAEEVSDASRRSLFGCARWEYLGRRTPPLPTKSVGWIVPTFSYKNRLDAKFSIFRVFAQKKFFARRRRPRRLDSIFPAPSDRTFNGSHFDVLPRLFRSSPPCGRSAFLTNYVEKLPPICGLATPPSGTSKRRHPVCAQSEHRGCRLQLVPQKSVQRIRISRNRK